VTSMDVTGAIRRHPGRTLALFAVILVVAVAGFLWFRPDRLITDDPVNEAVPGAPADEMAPAEAQDDAGAGGPDVLARGRFISLEHATRGQAVVLETPDGRRFLRFEGFETSNGPDLVVYLSAKEPAGPDDWHGYDRDFVDLGVLKGNVGSQNYEIPDGTDLDRHSTAVVWCRRFTVGFAAAPLAPPS
jgi:Electron transfer DM13